MQRLQPMLERVWWVLAWIVVLGVRPALAEPVPPADAVERIVLKSRVMGEDRPILVRTPPGYNGSLERFPVLYMTDGEGHLTHTAASSAFLRGISQAPDLIIVGIPNTDRTRDLTPVEQTQPPLAGSATPRRSGGGADRFLRFIETELMPEVERRFRTQPYRIFAGHSLGGLLAVHTLVSRPELFNAYIAISPALSWGDQVVLKRAEEQLKSPKDWKKTLFLGIANEQGGMRAAFQRLVELLEEHRPRALEWSVYRAEEEDHGSVVPGAHYVGLRRIYAGWNVTFDQTTGLVSGGLPALEAHYRRLSERFGYPIPIPEDLLNDQGYRLISRGDLDTAVAFFKANLELHPTSPNAHDSLGEAYERQDKLELARKHYVEAVALGKKSSDPDTPKFRANLERVTEKLK